MQYFHDSITCRLIPIYPGLLPIHMLHDAFVWLRRSWGTDGVRLYYIWHFVRSDSYIVCSCRFCIRSTTSLQRNQLVGVFNIHRCQNHTSLFFFLSAPMCAKHQQTPQSFKVIATITRLQIYLQLCFILPNIKWSHFAF